MARAVDLIAILLLILAPVAFCLGILALANQDDLAALYWLVVGGLVLKAASDILRPRSRSG